MILITKINGMKENQNPHAQKRGPGQSAAGARGRAPRAEQRGAGRDHERNSRTALLCAPHGSVRHNTGNTSTSVRGAQTALMKSFCVNTEKGTRVCHCSCLRPRQVASPGPAPFLCALCSSKGVHWSSVRASREPPPKWL